MTKFVTIALLAATLSAPVSFSDASPLVTDAARVVLAFSLFALMLLMAVAVVWGRSWTVDERR